MSSMPADRAAKDMSGAVDYLADGLVPVATPGGHRKLDLLPDYAAGLRALVGLTGIRPLTVVVDAGRGAAAVTVPVVLGTSPLTIVPLFFDQDPDLPPHPIDPADPATLADLRNAVFAHEADLGLGFVSDVGTCVVVD